MEVERWSFRTGRWCVPSAVTPLSSAPTIRATIWRRDIQTRNGVPLAGSPEGPSGAAEEAAAARDHTAEAEVRGRCTPSCARTAATTPRCHFSRPAPAQCTATTASKSTAVLVTRQSKSRLPAPGTTPAPALLGAAFHKATFCAKQGLGVCTPLSPRPLPGVSHPATPPSRPSRHCWVRPPPWTPSIRQAPGRR